MKKLILLLFIPLAFACSDDDNDNNNTPSEPTNFFEAHNGVWVTTYDDGTQNLLDIYDDGWDVYSRETNSGCWAIPPSTVNSGSTTTYTNTPNELYGESININASDLYSGDALEELLDAGYTTVSIAQSYLNYNSTVFTFCMIIYAGTFEEELQDICSTFYKQSSFNFEVCKEMSNNKYYNVSDKVLKLQSNIESLSKKRLLLEQKRID